jgi:plasmid stabilization system protein ParE
MVKWTPKSEQDLGEILEHISLNFTVDLAITTIGEIIDHVEATLTKNPLAGSILESNPLFYKLIYKGNTIYYCENPKDKNIYIVYVQPRKTDIRLDRITDSEVA